MSDQEQRSWEQKGIDLALDRAASEAKLRLLILEGAERWATKNGLNLNGEEALIRFFADRHHWMPHQVQSLSVEHLQILTCGTELDGAKRKKRELQNIKDLNRDLGIE